jgi:hypothetical protein
MEAVETQHRSLTLMKQFSALELFTWRSFKNDGSSAIGPYEIARISGLEVVNGESLLHLVQPDDTIGKTYAVNGPVSVDPDGYGECCTGPLVLVKYDGEEPSTDDVCGWVNGVGTVSKEEYDRPIVVCVGVVNSDCNLMLASISSYASRVCWATTEAAVATTDSTFTVTDIVPFDGSTWSGDDPLTVSNDPDAYKIDSGAKGKIISCVDPDTKVEEWHPLDFPWPC